MRRRRFLASGLVAAALAPAAARALTIEEIPHPRRPAAVPAGAVAWETLARAGGVHLAPEGVSRFPAALRALAGREVTLYGHMYPLQETGPHGRFLLAGDSYHCAYCMAADTRRIVLVEAAAPLAFREEPFALRGRLALVEDEASALFYRLTGARAG
jgi:hypothetical protein